MELTDNPGVPYPALADAVRHIREVVLREAMAMCIRTQPPELDPVGFRHASDEERRAYRVGHRQARMEIYDEIERMISREAPAPTAQAGYYASDGLEDGE